MGGVGGHIKDRVVRDLAAVLPDMFEWGWGGGLFVDKCCSVYLMVYFLYILTVTSDTTLWVPVPYRGTHLVSPCG